MRCTLNKYFDRGIETKSAPLYPTTNSNTKNDTNFNSVVKLYTQIEWICDHQI